MIIKICGVTNLDDASAAAELGAEYLGFNFHPESPRCITEPECRKIVAALQMRTPHPAFTGVFVNRPPSEVERIVGQCGLNAAQLSGDEPPSILAALAAAKITAFKSVRAPIGDRMLAEFAQIPPGEPALLLDASTPGLYGGTGKTADWDWARAIAARHPVFLAGGLTPENVAGAIRIVRPWGVDTASGVESSPGKKDLKKMTAFILNARKADRSLNGTIAPAQIDDAGEILALQKLAYRGEAELYGDFSIPPLTQTPAEIEAEFGVQRFLKATVDGQLVGSVRAEIRGGTCYIGRLIVHPDWQNRGIGGRLLRAAEGMYPDAERFELFTGDRSGRNLHLYQKLGYREFRRQALNERVTLVYLEKRN
jgi:phosphoribosylanthranilate isomerase/GNAT superfamily N-acetyltransferase